MRPSPMSANALFEDHRSRFAWEWVAGRRAADRRFDDITVQRANSGADLVGYLNYLHPDRLQVLGKREIDWLTQADDAQSERRMARIATLAAPALVLADGVATPPALARLCDSANIPLFATRIAASLVTDELRAYLSRLFADRTSVHGVFMDILGLGVLIRGESGLGKSELGLELISRGHGLVADDVVDLLRINHNVIEGRCPEVLQNMLEVRGIGLLDVRAIFGEVAVRRRMNLGLIVQLMPRMSGSAEPERLGGEPRMENVLDVPVHCVNIEVQAGRNLAVLVEAAVRNHILQLRGIDTYREFIARHREAMDENSRLTTF